MEGNKNLDSVKEIYKTIREKIGRLRYEKEESQAQLAKALGVTDRTIKAWEGGTRNPKLNQLVKIAEHYDVSLDYLFGRTENKTVDEETKYICAHTGLSEGAVDVIKSITINNDRSINDFIEKNGKLFFASLQIASAALETFSESIESHKQGDTTANLPILYRDLRLFKIDVSDSAIRFFEPRYSHLVSEYENLFDTPLNNTIMNFYSNNSSGGEI